MAQQQEATGQETRQYLPVSLYFTPEWWDRHCHADRPRPEECASQAALEALYLGRQRFLFEQFGTVGMGGQTPQAKACGCLIVGSLVACESVRT